MEEEQEEMQAIADMLGGALHYNLQTEVVWSYTNYIKSGMSVPDAALAALHDRDTK